MRRDRLHAHTPRAPRNRPLRPAAVLLLPALMLLLAAPSPASAQEIPCGKGPCIAERRPGTHFLAEVYGGGTVNRNGGFAVEGLLGVGGKLPRLPMRLYLITEVGLASSVGEGYVPGLPLSYRDERMFTDVSAGLRTYFPVFGPARLFFDVSGGGTYQSVTLERDQLPAREVDGWSPLAQISGGVQLRLLHHLSLGVRTKLVLTRQDPGGLYDALGEEPPLRTSITAGITAHF